MRIVFDTNIWVSFLIGKRLAVFKRFLNALILRYAIVMNWSVSSLMLRIVIR